MGEPIRVVVRPRGPAVVRTQRDKNLALGGIRDSLGRSLVLDPTQDGRTISMVIPRDERRRNGQEQPQSERWDMMFDSVLSASTTQQEMYDSCVRDLVDATLKGVNATVLAYGQTGSGKTYTMIGGGTRGNRASSFEDRGMAPRALSHLFTSARNAPSNVSIAFRVSYLEVYKERLYDLLGGDTNSPTTLPNGEEVRPWIASASELRHAQAHTEAEAMDLLFEGETNRVIASHQLNNNSTRSHCIFTIHVESTITNPAPEDSNSAPAQSHGSTVPVTRVAKINFVDLAGSERTSSTGSSGKVFEESLAINKSLSFLEQVVLALGEKSREHIPYRQSKLTTILEDSLGGNCATLMLACLWPDARHLDQSFATLRFAGRMARVQNKPHVNESRAPAHVIQQYELEIKQLRSELALHDQLTGTDASDVAREEFTPRGLRRLREEVETYVNGSGDVSTFAITSLRQMHAIMNCLKSMILEERKVNGRPQPNNQPELLSSARSCKSNRPASSEYVTESRPNRAGAGRELATASGLLRDRGSPKVHSRPAEPDKSKRFVRSSHRRAETADATFHKPSTPNQTPGQQRQSTTQPSRRMTADEHMQRTRSTSNTDSGKQQLMSASQQGNGGTRSSHVDEEAFAMWKKTNEGAELVVNRRQLIESLQETTHKSQQAKAAVNTCKHDMDLLITRLTEHREAPMSDLSDADNEKQERVEAGIVQELRQLKRLYKEAFRKFLNAKDEKNYQMRVVSQHDDEIAFKFREWQRKQWKKQSNHSTTHKQQQQTPQSRRDKSRKVGAITDAGCARSQDGDQSDDGEQWPLCSARSERVVGQGGAVALRPNATVSFGAHSRPNSSRSRASASSASSSRGLVSGPAVPHHSSKAMTSDIEPDTLFANAA
jgi:kinesin family protein 6/9